MEYKMKEYKYKPDHFFSSTDWVPTLLKMINAWSNSLFKYCQYSPDYSLNQGSPSDYINRVYKSDTSWVNSMIHLKERKCKRKTKTFL